MNTPAPRPTPKRNKRMLMPALAPKKRATVHTKRPKKSLPLNICRDHKPKKIASALDDKYIQYKREDGNKEIPIEKYLKNRYLHMLNDLRKTGA